MSIFVKEKKNTFQKIIDAPFKYIFKLKVGTLPEIGESELVGILLFVEVTDTREALFKMSTASFLIS